MKSCSKCKQLKPLTDFCKGDLKDGRRSDCKNCQLIQVKSYRAANPDKVKKWNKTAKVKLFYGLTLEKYEELEKLQNGLCAVCGLSNSQKLYNRSVSLHIDHNHETGKIRGLLCHKCNTALGLANDDPTILRKLVDYLEKNG